MISVTTADLGDAAALADVASATFPLACPPPAHPDDIAACVTENLSADRFADYLTDSQRLVLAAHDTGRIIGYAMLISADGTVELSKMYVLPEYHRTGAAAKLMDAGLAWASSCGAQSVWLGVNRHNERARRFYRKHGFEVTGTRVFRLGSSLEDDFVMTRPLPVSE